MKFNFLFVLVFLVLVASAFATISVTDCANLTAINVSDTYLLANNITCNSAQENREIVANNSAIDCNGYKITVDGSYSYFIRLGDYDNFTFANCIVLASPSVGYGFLDGNGDIAGGTILFENNTLLNFTSSVLSSTDFIFTFNNNSVQTMSWFLEGNDDWGAIIKNNVINLTANFAGTFVQSRGTKFYNNTFNLPYKVNAFLYVHYGTVEFIDNNVSLSNVTNYVFTGSTGYDAYKQNNFYSLNDINLTGVWTEGSVTCTGGCKNDFYDWQNPASCDNSSMALTTMTDANAWCCESGWVNGYCQICNTCYQCNGNGGITNYTNTTICDEINWLNDSSLLDCSIDCYDCICSTGETNLTINSSIGIINASCEGYYSNYTEMVNNCSELTCYKCVNNQYTNSTMYGNCCNTWYNDIEDFECEVTGDTSEVLEEMNMIGIIILLVALLITGEIFKNLILRVVFSLGIIAYSINQLTTTNGLFWFLGILLGALWFWRASMIYSSNE